MLHILIVLLIAVNVFAFPSSPSNGDYWQQDGTRFKYDSTAKKWDKLGKVLYVSPFQYSSLQTEVGIQAALTAMGSSEEELVIDEEFDINNDITIPSNVKLRVSGGGLLTIASGKTLTIAGDFEAPKVKVFDGVGSVTGLKESYIEWFGAVGDGVTDNASSIQKAIDSTSSLVKCKESSLGYSFDSQITNLGIIPFQCSSELIFSGSGEDALVIGDSTQASILYKNRPKSTYNVKRTSKQWSDAFAGIVLNNVKYFKADIEVQNFNEGLVVKGNDDGVGYGDIYLGNIYNNKTAIKLWNSGTTGWVNQNIFYNGNLTVNNVLGSLNDIKAVDIQIDNTNTIDNNLFINTACQLTQNELTKRAFCFYSTAANSNFRSNYALGMRFETLNYTTFRLLGGDGSIKKNRFDISFGWQKQNSTLYTYVEGIDAASTNKLQDNYFQGLYNSSEEQNSKLLTSIDRNNFVTTSTGIAASGDSFFVTFTGPTYSKNYVGANITLTSDYISLRDTTHFIGTEISVSNEDRDVYRKLTVKADTVTRYAKVYYLLKDSGGALLTGSTYASSEFVPSGNIYASVENMTKNGGVWDITIPSSAATIIVGIFGDGVSSFTDLRRFDVYTKIGARIYTIKNNYSSYIADGIYTSDVIPTDITLPAGSFSLNSSPSANESYGWVYDGTSWIDAVSGINRSLVTATGNETALQLNYTTNKLTSGNDTGLEIIQTDTASPGTSLLIDARVGASSKLKVSNEGEITAAGISSDGTGKGVCIKADGNLGTCTDALGAGGTCTCS